MRRVGYRPDTDSFYEDMNAEEFITLMGQLSGFPRDESLVRARERIELLQMSAFAHRRIREYSKGMRQRVKLAAALIHGPEVLILDEPLNGLGSAGPQACTRFTRKIGDRRDELSVVSSHILHEIEALTDRILLIHRGRVLAEGRIEEIRFLIENQPLTYRIVSRERRRIAGELAKLESVMALTFAELPEDALEVRTNRPAELFEVIQNGVVARQWSVEEVSCGGRQFGRGLPVLGERVSHPMSMLSQIQALTRITNYRLFRGKVRLVLLLWVGLLPSLVKLP